MIARLCWRPAAEANLSRLDKIVQSLPSLHINRNSSALNRFEALTYGVKHRNCIKADAPVSGVVVCQNVSTHRMSIELDTVILILRWLNRNQLTTYTASLSNR
jgi:hypothetical protein